jgi:hypothetical protein
MFQGSREFEADFFRETSSKKRKEAVVETAS